MHRRGGVQGWIGAEQGVALAEHGPGILVELTPQAHAAQSEQVGAQEHGDDIGFGIEGQALLAPAEGQMRAGGIVVIRMGESVMRHETWEPGFAASAD